MERVLTPMHAHAFRTYGLSKAAPVPRHGAARRFRECGCGLAERREYRDGALAEVRIRLAPYGEWVSPLDVLNRDLASEERGLVDVERPDHSRLTVELHLIRCPRCSGQRYDVGSCGLCRNLGVLDEQGDPLR